MIWWVALGAAVEVVACLVALGLCRAADRGDERYPDPPARSQLGMDQHPSAIGQRARQAREARECTILRLEDLRRRRLERDERPTS